LDILKNKDLSELEKKKILNEKYWFKNILFIYFLKKYFWFVQ
jgi:hypothetical protein